MTTDELTATDVTRIIKDSGLSQRHAADKLGVRHSTLWRWMTGKRRCRGPAATMLRSWDRDGVPEDEPCDCMDCSIAGEPTH